MVKIKLDNQVVNKAVYLALGLNCEGEKEVLGLWCNATEGAKFWLSVLTELKNRGVANVLIFCCDGLVVSKCPYIWDRAKTWCPGPESNRHGMLSPEGF